MNHKERELSRAFARERAAANRDYEKKRSAAESEEKLDLRLEKVVKSDRAVEMFLRLGGITIGDLQEGNNLLGGEDTP